MRSRRARREREDLATSGNLMRKGRRTTTRIQPTTPISPTPIPKRRMDRSGNSLPDPSTSQHLPSPNYETSCRNESPTFKPLRNPLMDLRLRRLMRRLELRARGRHSRERSCWRCEGSRGVSCEIIVERSERRNDARRNPSRLNGSLVMGGREEERRMRRRRSLARSSRTTKIDRGKSQK